MKKYTLSCLLALAGAMLLPLHVRAATTTFSVQVGTNGPGQSLIDETLSVTLSSSNSYWYGADFYANGINGNNSSYSWSGTLSHQGPGTSSFDGFLPQGSGFASSGQYYCYANAHGMNYDTSPPNPWSAGVTAVTVTVP